MPGMVYSGGDRVLAVDDTHALWSSGQNEPYWELLDAWVIPDFTDPATIGCLLEQAREAWQSPRLQTSPMLQPAPLEWICHPNACEDDVRRYIADTEVQAILAAIAAAPPRSKP